MWGGVGQGSLGLHEARTVIPVVTQGRDEAVCDGAHDSNSTRCDSGNARYWAGNWHGWPSLSETLGSGMQC
jgi:hypothetical protein